MEPVKVAIHRKDECGNVYTLLEELRCSGVIVPVGFESDGASVPRFFWRIVFPPGDSRAMRAAFVHDFIYRTRPACWSREDADDIFAFLLESEGIPSWRAYLAWFGVRLFGWASWGKKGGDEC